MISLLVRASKEFGKCLKTIYLFIMEETTFERNLNFWMRQKKAKTKIKTKKNWEKWLQCLNENLSYTKESNELRFIHFLPFN